MNAPSSLDRTLTTNIKRYLGAYSPQIQQQVHTLIASGKSADWLLKKYPQAHALSSERQLYDYAMSLKNQFMRSSSPISKVVYDDKIHVINNALGMHTYVSRVQGSKLKAKHEIRIARLFKSTPEAMLRMILVHELAHLKEKEHNKAFYRLCCHMDQDYHQLEFELRLYLAHKAVAGDVW